MKERPNHTKGEPSSAQKKMYFYFIISTAAVLAVALICASVLEFIFLRVNIIAPNPDFIRWYWIVIFASTSIIIGLVLAAVLGKFLFRPINTVMDGMTHLVNGEYSTRINLERHEGFQELARTFNTLAAELESTEILRSSFVNDFSHELKTPIVSLVGLIGLMKNEKLSEDKRRRYLDIMETEANRLRQMTSSTLYLSKLETQNILTDKAIFNISEQIRASVLLLERKWSAKSLTLDMDFDDFNIMGNEDMLKEVWINLIDNAIKFAYPNSTLKIELENNSEQLLVKVQNEGDPIPEKSMEQIFQKFYQADPSRATEGNGIGLSIVKHIVTLHDGAVTAECKDGKTSFTVALPI